MGVGGPEEVYLINSEEVTKEEWLKFRQKFEYHKEWENKEEEIIMNNECHHDDREEEAGENNNDKGDLQHEETIATLQFPILKTYG